MRYFLTCVAALLSASIGSSSVLTALIPEGTIEANLTIDWTLNPQPAAGRFVGVSLSAANQGNGVFPSPEAGVSNGAIAGASQLRADVLRFPDDVSQSYHWRATLGSRSTLDTDTFGFLANRSSIADMMVTVNMVTAAKEDAWQWVSYMNSPTTTEWGQERAKHGVAEPYNAHYWLLGEDIASYKVAFPTATDYVRSARENATAMKLVSPSIEVGLWITDGSSEELRTWNSEMLTAASAADVGLRGPVCEVSGLFDFLAVRVSVDVPNRPVTDQALFPTLYSYAAERARTVVQAAEQAAQSVGCPPPLAVYRYDLDYGLEGWNFDKADSMGAAITLSGMLNEFMRHEAVFTTIYRGLNTDSFAAVLKVPRRYDVPQNERFALNPIGELLATFGQYFAGTALQIDFGGAGATASKAFYHGPAVGRIPSQEPVPLLTIGASFDLVANQMVIWISSRSSNDRVVVHVTVRNTGTHTFQAHTLAQAITGPTLSADRYASFDRVQALGHDQPITVATPEAGTSTFDLEVTPISINTFQIGLAT
jgi:hypothetical protein